VTITQGMSEVDSADRMPMDPSKSRKKGGGRKLAEEKIPGLTDVIEDFMEPHTGGDPMNPLKWTSKSLRAIEEALAQKGYIVSDTTIGEILRKLGYTLQANRKDISISASHPDRDAQFEYINRTAQEYMAAGWPVVSVDAKKKEKIGNFKNYGTEYVRKGKATKVLDHDFDQSA
jgi:hypothetical protein